MTRIASLLPAATEIVRALGLADDLVAVTFECSVHDQVPVVVDTAIPHGLAPAEIDAWVRDRVAAGLAMYELDREALAALKPDLILTQDLCRVCALPAGTVEDACRAIGTDAAVVSLDPHCLSDVFADIETVAAAAGVPATGKALAWELRRRVDAVAAAVCDRTRPRVLILEWTDPPFLAGHWVPELVRRAGGTPVGAVEGGRSVTVDWAELPAADLVLVAPCGFGLDAAIEQSAVVAEHRPDVPLLAIDSANYVVQAGPGLVDGIEALAWAFHPDAVPVPPAGRIAWFTGE
jgi:iron complex transport system substrate-binding protein